MLCKQNTVWFDYAKQGNIDKLMQLSDKFKNQRDTRDSDPDKKIFNGFCAIHYAIYCNHLEAFAVLEEYEASCKTGEAITFPNPFHKGNIIKLGSESNCLQLALLINAEKIATYILTQIMEGKPLY